MCDETVGRNLEQMPKYAQGVFGRHVGAIKLKETTEESAYFGHRSAPAEREKLSLDNITGSEGKFTSII